jgi:hypothetical protein
MRIEKTQGWPNVPWWAVAIVVTYFSLVGLGVGVAQAAGTRCLTMCLFQHITGHPCPTCGSTRMVLAAAKGNFQDAAAYNPLMFSLAVLGLVLIAVRIGFRRRIVWMTSTRSRRILTTGLVVAVLANWLYLLGAL